MKYPSKLITIIIVCFFALNIGKTAFSQSKSSPYVNSLGQLKYSSLDNWYSRKLKESVLLSGNTIELYGVGNVDAKADLFDMKLKDPTSPWGTTNVFAKMVLDVGNTRVIPEKRGNGFCARLETKIRKDNIAGFKVNVLLSGTLFVGEMIEPVHGIKDPIKNTPKNLGKMPLSLNCAKTFTAIQGEAWRHKQLNSWRKDWTYWNCELKNATKTAWR